MKYLHKIIEITKPKEIQNKLTNKVFYFLLTVVHNTTYSILCLKDSAKKIEYLCGNEKDRFSKNSANRCTFVDD